MSSLLTIRPLSQDFASPRAYPVESKLSLQKHFTVNTPCHPFSTLYLEAPHSSTPSVLIKSRLNSLYRSASVGGSMGSGYKDKNVPSQARSQKISNPRALKPSRQASSVQTFDERSSKNARVIRRKPSIASLSTAATGNNSPIASTSAIPRPSSSTSCASSLSPTRGPDPAEDLVDVKEPNTPLSLEVDPESRDTFIEMNNWLTRNNTKVHPYIIDAPYMQAYNSVPLQSDRYTDILLQRLVPAGSPSFHDYGKRPPASVLDLGCGPGHWMLYAAGVWKTSNITGFDIVDVTLPEFETTENVHFVRGNFIKYTLPFPSGSFELVRMANLALCIPYDKWQHVLVEVRRVLTTSGRLELIDDQIFFPYGNPPLRKGQFGNSLHRDASVDIDAIDDENDGTSENDEWADANSTFSDEDSCQSPLECAQDSISRKGKATISPAATLTPDDFVQVPTEKPISPPPVRPAESDLSIWNYRAARSRDLEIIFERMLTEKYGIHSRPSQFILDLLEDTFGTGRAKKMNSFHLKIAPFDPSVNEDLDKKDATEPSLVSNLSFSGAKRMWNARDSNKQEGRKGRKKTKAVRASNGEKSNPDDSVPDPSVITPKLADRLGIAYPGAQFSEIPVPAPSSLKAKAAARLGIPYPVVPVSRNSSTDSGSSSERSSLEGPPLPPKDARYLDLLLTVERNSLTGTGSSSNSSTEQLGLDIPTTQSLVLSAKAAGRLGITCPGLAAAASDSTPLPTRHTVQPSGLLLWPNTYIPLSPEELEMHCCKHMQSLVGCRHGLIEFMTAHRDEYGERLASDDEILSTLWDYECFRRSRLNWPLGSIDHSSESEQNDLTPPSSSAGVSHQISNHSRNLSDPTIQTIHSMDLNHVRTIHVFEARKFDDLPFT